MASNDTGIDLKERLIKAVKKEVKQIMEESVILKFVHQDSSSVTSLCAAVECCLSHGLRRRALGLFRSSSTTALLHKVAKGYPPANTISKLVLEAEAVEGLKRSSSSGDSITRMISSSGVSGSFSNKPPLQKKNSSSWLPKNTTMPKYLWIRLALFERILVGIIEHLIQNSSKYYEKDALLVDPEYGSVLSHLLVGPCALEFTRMKTQDHYWTDPPADELVQRHRISSGSAGATSPANRRPGLVYRKLNCGGSGDGDFTNVCSGINRICSSSSSAKEYVESLHQNNKAALLYGKNNVLVPHRDLPEAIPGYLSLHHTPNTLTLKWTPNQLMNGAIDSEGRDKSTFWDYALHVNLYDIVYVHCHQQGDEGGSMVLVGHDGVSRPTIHFPAGGHLLAFLTCLESGLQPNGRLDPPLVWSQTGKGKIFPKIKRKGLLFEGAVESATFLNENVPSESNGNQAAKINEERHAVESADYVFRIVITTINISENLNLNSDDLLDENSYSIFQGFLRTPISQHIGMSCPRSPRWSTSPRCGPLTSSDSIASSSSSSKSLNTSLSLIENMNSQSPHSLNFTDGTFSFSNKTTESTLPELHRGESLHVLCKTMRRQIISRAFYGWYAHCRHLRTVRTHLSGLVNDTIVSCYEPCDATKGVDGASWAELTTDGVLKDFLELNRLTFYGGVSPCLRKQVWPYLLGHYVVGSNAEERESQNTAMRTAYETTMSEWLAVEAIIRQRDKENTAATIAKVSTTSQSGEGIVGNLLLSGQNPNLSNEVFDDNSSCEEFDCTTDGETEKGNESESCKDATTTDLSIGQNLQTEHWDTLVGSILVSTHPITGNEDVFVTEKSESDETIPGDSNTNINNLGIDDALDKCSMGSSCVSPVSSQGGVYSLDLLEAYSLNLHRIEKDVQRCDRNHYFFTPTNLDKLRNIMCTYVWCHLETGYMQGMCDLAAPLLVVFEDEALTYSCFSELMKRMAVNFPQVGGIMDQNFANMRSLIQILDVEIFDLMHKQGDYTHFYFCYRWLLLDFKRELNYDDVFLVWETIWAARSIASPNFVLFVAVALVEIYRDIILGNSMDFTEIIKFFNEMAERHNASRLLVIARELVLQIQTLIENK